MKYYHRLRYFMKRKVIDKILEGNLKNKFGELKHLNNQIKKLKKKL